MREIVCGVCKGKGFLINPRTGVLDLLCPNCNGRGTVTVN